MNNDTAKPIAERIDPILDEAKALLHSLEHDPRDGITKTALSQLTATRFARWIVQHANPASPSPTELALAAEVSDLLFVLRRLLKESCYGESALMADCGIGYVTYSTDDGELRTNNKNEQLERLKDARELAKAAVSRAALATASDDMAVRS